MIPNRFLGFDGSFLQKLERLSLLSRRPLAGPSVGPRRAKSYGSSVEFADFRDYTPGDDFRRIDWNAYARLDRLFLRLYSAEQMTTLTLMLDHSASMQFGLPSKALTTARLAAIFSYIALRNYDRVAVVGWGEKADRYVPAQMGKTLIPRVWQEISDIMTKPSGSTDFGALREYASRLHGPGLSIILSDLLTDSNWRLALQQLRGSGQEVCLVQVMAPEELRPGVRGDWVLRDAESDAGVEVTISPRLLRRYEEELEAHTSNIRDFCRHQDIAFLQVPSNIPFDDDLLSQLYKARVLG